MVNWSEQWALHAPNFFDGFAHVSLKDYGGPDRSFKLAPGGGFGDLSHPTTRLMLHLMPKTIDQPVIDVGCGSGVLSLSAKVLGASHVTGIDVENDAIAHAQINNALNQLDCFFGRHLPHIPENPLILMNMISSEQKHAWASLPNFESYTLIVSGYPIKEEDPTQYGKCILKKELEGWKAFVIRK